MERVVRNDCPKLRNGIKYPVWPAFSLPLLGISTTKANEEKVMRRKFNLLYIL